MEHVFIIVEKVIDEYIEYHNTKRIKTKSKGLTSCQAREQALLLSNLTIVCPNNRVHDKGFQLNIL